MKLDLNNTVYLQIGGEIGKNNSLSLDYFAELAKNFQTLINSIVENDLSVDETISMKNFKVELVDFRTGSAVPGFRFTKDTLMLVGGDPIDQRKKVSDKFETLIKMAHAGDYLNLKILYPDYNRRNTMVKSLYNFVDSIKTPQATFINFKKDEIIPLYQVKLFKKITRDSLIVEVKDDKKDDPIFKYGKVKITKSNGKERRTVKEVYNTENTKITHVFELIKTENKIYKLTTPLMCTLDKEDDGYIIESLMLGVIGSGETREEAITNFCQEFDSLNMKLKGLKYDQLSQRMKTIKTFFTVLIESAV